MSKNANMALGLIHDILKLYLRYIILNIKSDYEYQP